MRYAASTVPTGDKFEKSCGPSQDMSEDVTATKTRNLYLVINKSSDCQCNGHDNHACTANEATSFQLSFVSDICITFFHRYPCSLDAAEYMLIAHTYTY